MMPFTENGRTRGVMDLGCRNQEFWLQGFSTVAYWPYRPVNPLLWRLSCVLVMLVMGCLMAALASAHYMPVAYSLP